MIFKCIHVVLDALLRVGDRVIMNADDGGDSWHYKSQQERALQGRRGTVIGFDERIDHVSRYGDFGRRPGVYRARGRAQVLWDGEDGLVTAPSLHDLSWWPWAQGEEPQGDIVKLILEIQEHNKTMNKDRQALRPKDFRVEWEQERVLIAELPDFPFYELDVVRDPDGDLVVVEAIDWRSLGDKCSDGSPYPVVRIKHLERGYSTSYRAEELTLVEPGNVRLWFTGEKARMRFDSDGAEVAFFDGIGLVETVLSLEATRDVPQEALDAIREGRADAIRLPSIPFTRTRQLELVRLTDREVGERIRKKSLDGFGLLAGV